MDIRQNTVRIRTGLQVGSGIIYPCECSKKYEDGQLFIIFTNKHLVADLHNIQDNSSIKKMVEFDIYDNNGNLIDANRILDLKLYYADALENNNIDDIAAFLVSFDYKVDIDLERKLLWDDKKLNIIYMEGFPKVLYDNNISSKMQMRGKYKNTFPENKKIGIFQIMDDYHWYNNFKDLKLFQGFSGGLVYSVGESSNSIVGLNQSVLNVDDGENPFKLLYYYKIRYVLEYLREKGCIIFRRNKDCSVTLRWIHGNK